MLFTLLIRTQLEFELGHSTFFEQFKVIILCVFLDVLLTTNWFCRNLCLRSSTVMVFWGTWLARWLVLLCDQVSNMSKEIIFWDLSITVYIKLCKDEIKHLFATDLFKLKLFCPRVHNTLKVFTANIFSYICLRWLRIILLCDDLNKNRFSTCTNHLL